MFAFLFLSPPLSLLVSLSLSLGIKRFAISSIAFTARRGFMSQSFVSVCVKIIRNLLPREFQDPLAPFPVIISPGQMR